MAITWDQSMSTGITSVDDQHRKLIDAIGGLMEALASGKAKDQIAPLLEWLATYAARHFAHEEAAMKQLLCPAAQENKAQHAQFLRMLGEFRTTFQREGPKTSMVLEVQRSLLDWLRNHIMRIDKQLAPLAAAA